jgi:hypothetical protein
VIRIDGIQVRRILIPDLADRLIHAGENDLASILLDASAQQHDVELTDSERAILLPLLKPGSPDGLGTLRVALVQRAS